MRILLVGLALVVCAAVPAHAQERQVGAKAGLSLGRLEMPRDDDTEHLRRAAAGGGGFLVLPVAPRLAVQIEALYVQKGGRLRAPEIEQTAGILLDYLEVPVLLRVGGSRRGAPGGLHALGGVAGAFRVSARRQFSVPGQWGTVGESHDMGREIERFEASAVLGAGLDLGRHLVIDGLYAWGLTPVNRDRSGDFRVRTRTLLILAGVRF